MSAKLTRFFALRWGIIAAGTASCQEDWPGGYSQNPPDGRCIWGFFRLQWSGWSADLSALL